VLSSVCRTVDQLKMVEIRIVQFSPYSSPISDRLSCIPFSLVLITDFVPMNCLSVCYYEVTLIVECGTDVIVWLCVFVCEGHRYCAFHINCMVSHCFLLK